MFQIREIVKPSGFGRTASWGGMFGIVTEVLDNSVYVSWYGLEFEDQMRFDELVSTGRFAESLPDDYRLLRIAEDETDGGEIIESDN